MGFSVSGSAAIIFVAFFIAFGSFYTATSNSMELINDAQGEDQDALLTQQNTAIDHLDARYYADNETLIVTVNNTGATALSVSAVDLLVDNVKQDVSGSVNGDSETDIWAPGSRLRYNVEFTTQPDRVLISTGPGISDTEVVVNG